MSTRAPRHSPAFSRPNRRPDASAGCTPVETRSPNISALIFWRRPMFSSPFRPILPHPRMAPLSDGQRNHACRLLAANAIPTPRSLRVGVSRRWPPTPHSRACRLLEANAIPVRVGLLAPMATDTTPVRTSCINNYRTYKRFSCKPSPHAPLVEAPSARRAPLTSSRLREVVSLRFLPRSVAPRYLRVSGHSSSNGTPAPLPL
jgi:hypothetical protein